ncbi:selenocysteine-specific translation elongation factor [Thermomicrobiaceae bacterium CFH 74404]|uniref:Selenocysteine-specific elongation factor n=1 Tax=Thermalbibacter longus TaxID=2951981 RepID=A0AA42BAF1_9BACT|nr:selenocysteine-specific translation elongation factor [Thermalbibacter longus]MCM8748440.1 selenocysteine-specific translation elongation factor [Thermalbibacter longus]
MTTQPQTYVIGTAGHVDHGKSTLVKALTGIDPDRLREEKEREMTIDLGFAWLSLPSGRRVSVIDVPGHERFIKNMLAGVGGFDAALLVIAADEGPMPQTAEHLAIIDLLQIRHGLVALTKVDLVDEEWRELVTVEVLERLRGTVLDGAEIVAVSAVTGEGLPELVAALDRLLEQVPPHLEAGHPRLAVDRVFTMPGFGTIVTGTLRGGPLEVGQEVELLPTGKRGRVRGLQSHRVKVERAQPGSRTAVNLSGIAVEEIERGHVLTTPGWLRPTTLLDARLRLIPEAPQPLEQNDEVDFFIGAAETLARVTLLDAERLDPGGEGWVQFRFPEPVVAVRGDRFIIRRPSPGSTIGGGVVVDAHPRRHRRFRPEVIRALEILSSGTPQELVLQALDRQPRELREVIQQTGLPETEVRATIEELAGREEITRLGTESGLTQTTLLIRSDALRALAASLAELLNAYHERYPLRRGMPREEVRSRLGLAPRAFDEAMAALARRGEIVEEADTIRSPHHQIRFTPEQQARIDRYLAALRAQPYSPPAPAEFELEPELVAALVDTGAIVRVDEGIVFARETFEEIQRTVLELIDRQGSLTLAQFRDHFGTSRKYAQAVLEYLDQRRVTRRVGDTRVRYGHG